MIRVADRSASERFYDTVLATLGIDGTYRTPTENHHPMEPHATIAVWEGDRKLTIFDATQGVKGAQGITAHFFGLLPDEVQVISPFIGGGFGCKGSVWHHVLLTSMAAKAVAGGSK